ncbi:MAG: hypothetical protein EPO55_02010 [Reyranella sp.]|uniref:hypothetical protein n=1 Tax=Reyranella sp. TaxID=1929291 RepID=UPI001210278D|nr:hypothetical protein [Reyranella sp.]TAJ42433.1 MAG: hypothetical protein EPO55_02010 [Reyranella sp.]
MTTDSRISADLGEPILFRTTISDVYNAAVKEGSLWLRSAEYYRQLEDKVRNDCSEGVSAGRTTVPLRVGFGDDNMLNIQGAGTIGQVIVPHYILSLHGSSISPAQLQSFGGFTFGIRSLFKLTMEIFHQASQVIDCYRYRFGAISYRYTALSQARAVTGSGAIQLSENPPLYLNPSDTDVLRKLPITPFIEQDEWRIVVFTNGHIDGDANAPLKIKVRPSHFYPYSSASG